MSRGSTCVEIENEAVAAPHGSTAAAQHNDSTATAVVYLRTPPYPPLSSFSSSSLFHLFSAHACGSSDDEDDEGTPPLVVVGMEGIWGTLIMLTVIYPITYMLPGDDHGSYENFHESVAGLMNNPDLFATSMVYVAAITTYNVSAIFITQLLESVR